MSTKDGVLWPLRGLKQFLNFYGCTPDGRWLAFAIYSPIFFIKMKNKYFFLLTAFTVLPWFAQAQFDEFGTFVGISNYAGDLTDRGLEPLEFNMAIGLFVRFNLKERLALKTHLYRGVISGKDANTAVDRGLWQRNLSFRSEIYEVGAQFEYDLFRMENGLSKSAPFVFVGVAGYYFNPQAELNGKTYNLNTYRTEGVEYSLVQFAVPFGLGYKMALSDRGKVGIELGWRKTFTDYLDDVSNSYPDNIRALAEANALSSRLSYRSPEIIENAPPATPGQGRGNPDKKDWYMFFGLTLAVNVGK